MILMCDVKKNIKDHPEVIARPSLILVFRDWSCKQVHLCLRRLGHVSDLSRNSLGSFFIGGAAVTSSCELSKTIT